MTFEPKQISASLGNHLTRDEPMLYMKEIELAARLIHSPNIDELMDCVTESTTLVDTIDAPSGAVDPVSTSGLEVGQGRRSRTHEPVRAHDLSSGVELQP